MVPTFFKLIFWQILLWVYVLSIAQRGITTVEGGGNRDRIGWANCHEPLASSWWLVSFMLHCLSRPSLKMVGNGACRSLSMAWIMAQALMQCLQWDSWTHMYYVLPGAFAQQDPDLNTFIGRRSWVERGKGGRWSILSRSSATYYKAGQLTVHVL
jgi:hypothetical protein